MKFRTSLLLLGLVIVLAGGTFLIALAVIDRDEDQPQTEPQPTQQTDFEAEALTAAELMTTWTPAEDFNRTDAELRATHLMTEELANSITAPERPATGQEWLDAAEANATSQPTVEVNNYTDTEHGTVSVFASWEWIAESGETLPNEEQERIYYFAFNDQGQIHDYTYETVRQGPSQEN